MSLYTGIANYGRKIGMFAQTDRSGASSDSRTSFSGRGRNHSVIYFFKVIFEIYNINIDGYSIYNIKSPYTTAVVL